MINLDKEIFTIGETSSIQFKNGYESKAAQATNWDLGQFSKAWVVEVNTSGYHNITISSRQQSGGEDPGPKDFKLQYSLNNGVNWTDIPDGVILVENDWTTSYVDNLSLPEECDDKNDLLICWMVTSKLASGNGGEVEPEGKSKIDDIYVKGEKINGIEEFDFDNIVVYPNPASDFINIDSKYEVTEIFVFGIGGSLLINSKSTNTLSLSGLPKGNYILGIKFEHSFQIFYQKINLR